MAYLVILVLVAVIGLSRLWIQQRREQSQMETIEGFSSVLEAIAPPEPQPRRAGRNARAGVKGTLQGWLTTRVEPLDHERRAEVRLRIQARRAAGSGRGLSARRGPVEPAHASTAQVRRIPASARTAGEPARRATASGRAVGLQTRRAAAAGRFTGGHGDARQGRDRVASGAPASRRR